MEIAGDWIYYTDDPNDRVSHLYRIRTDGTCKTKISDDRIDDFIIVDDWIYCTILESHDDFENGGRIYKMRTDGSNKIKLSDENVEYFNVDNGWIYFNNEKLYEGFYIMDTQGMRKTKIDDAAFDIRIFDDWVYYLSFGEEGLYRVNTNGREKTLLDTHCREICGIYNDFIYYITRNPEYEYEDDQYNTFKRIKTDGSFKAELAKGDLSEINFSGDYIYYIDFTDSCKSVIFGGNIFRMNPDGTEKTRLNNSKSINIGIYDNWIFYENKAHVYGELISRGIIRMKTDGSERKRITKGMCGILDVQDEWVYYRTLGAAIDTDTYEVKVCRIKKDGTGNTQLFTVECNRRDIILGWI